VPYAILHCHADPDRLRERVARRRAQGADPSEADLPVLARQQDTAEPLAPEERALALDVDTGTEVDVDALHRRWLAGTGGVA
jgi:predicted kinase